ncbi:hypothetical protein [Streptomyces ziwulingensis]|uniref:DUF4034 domain-containing protein n=1 Tax=Streptomyces ziwulingensis TaxID=1045501 RepID=A0ABP9CR62_9ACTN
MVDTMVRLRALIRSARLRGTPPRPAAEAPVGDEVLLDAPDDRLGPALVAAAHGAHEPAAGLLAGTRESAEWEHRDRYTARLAAFAHARPEWLRTWQTTAPGDQDGLLVRARLAVDRCWQSPDRAELLRQSAPAVTAAAEAGGSDPVPWRIALDSARGRRAGHAEFERLWAEAVRRAPHHYGCHLAALEYLATASPGAHRECLDFAETAARDAPEGSLVRALPLRAAFRYLTDGTAGTVERARLDTAADLALTLSAGLPPADPWPAELRNLLAYVLIRLGRGPDAAEQLRLTGPYATSFPWDRGTDDPLGRFLAVREEVRGAAARGGPGAPAPPWNGRCSRAGRGDH